MNVSCNNESILLFEKLSVLPFLRVYGHLNASSLVLNALLSKKWEALIKRDGMRVESVWHMKITQNEVWIQVDCNKKNKRNENLLICFKEAPGMEKDVEVHQKNNFFTIFHKTNQRLEESCCEALHLINFLFPPVSYGHINLSLGSRSPDFPFRFLLLLPGGTAESVRLYADQEVDGAGLVAFLRNVKVSNEFDYQRRIKLDSGVRIKNVVKCDEIVFENMYIRIDDARFLSIDSLKRLDFIKFQAGQNDFNSKDFNVLLRAWMNAGTWCRVANVTFDIRKDQNIKMEEVMEGLEPHVGTPRIRDRWHFDHAGGGYDSILCSTVTDFADGWDIVDKNGRILTVLLEPNRLIFNTWGPSAFRWHGYVESVESLITSFKQYIRRLNQMRDIIQRKVDAGKMELFPDQVEFLEQYPEKMRIQQERLAKACDMKEKLQTIWKNDENVYVPPPPLPPLPPLSPNCRLRRSSSSRTILLFGSADIALDEIPLALKFEREQFGRYIRYYKMEGLCKIQIITITDIASTSKDLLRSMLSIMYAYSDSDSFNRLSTLFISLGEKFEKVLNYPIRHADSMLVHLPGSADNGQPDQLDVESFQRSSWSDASEFDAKSLNDIEEFVIPIM